MATAACSEGAAPLPDGGFDAPPTPSSDAGLDAPRPPRRDAAIDAPWAPPPDAGPCLPGRLAGPGWVSRVDQRPTYVAHADFDCDGLEDLMLGHYVQPHERPVALRMMRGQASGQLLPGPRIAPSEAAFAVRPYAGDFDGDGRADLLVSSNTAPGEPVRTELFRGRCDGFDPPVPAPQVNSGFEDVVVADFDGDGFQDVAHEAGGVRVEFGGVPPFTRVAGVTAIGESAAVMRAGDFDGDGDLDLVRGWWMVEQKDVWLNDGAGRFSGPVHLPPAIATPVVGRFDADARDDVALVRADGDGNGYVLDLYTDVLATPPTPAVSYPLPDAFWDGPVDQAAHDIRDIDGDGDGDVVAWGLRLLQGPAGTIVRGASTCGRGGASRLTIPSRCVVADFTGDGLADELAVPVARFQSPYDRLVVQPGLCVSGEVAAPDGTWRQRCDGAAAFSEVVYGLPAAGDQLRMADLDGDGREDVVYRSLDNDVVVLLRSGDGVWPFEAARTIDVDALTIRCGDVDGDGVDEVVYAGDEPGFGVIELTPSVSVTRHIPPVRVSPAALGDLDGDGADELIVHVREGDDAGRLAEIRGAELTSLVRVGETFINVSLDAGALDFDGDGILDLFLAEPFFSRPATNGGPGHRCRLRLGTVPDTGWESWAALDWYGAGRCSFGDIEGDGDLDVVLTDGFRVAVGALAPSPTSAARVALVPAEEVVFATRAADVVLGRFFEGSGQDLVAAVAGGGLRIIATDGAGVVLPRCAPHALSTLSSIDQLVTVDLDGDGYSDVLGLGFAASGPTLTVAHRCPVDLSRPAGALVSCEP